MCWVGFRPGQPWKGEEKCNSVRASSLICYFYVPAHCMFVFFFLFSLVDVVSSFTMGVCLVGE